ncbi:conserved hypothetical protein [Parafrankia sp. Ea1.12]|nr:conserved hypothetical protein [Parafrankia sp. Ea1.12]
MVFTPGELDAFPDGADDEFNQ